MRIRTYEEWQEHVISLGATIAGPCIGCEGDGVVTEECCECGQDKETDCELCDGTGQGEDVDWDRLRDSPKDRKAILTLGLYRDAVTSDMVALWEHSRRIERGWLDDHGLLAYSPLTLQRGSTIRFCNASNRGEIIGHATWPQGKANQLVNFDKQQGVAA